MRSQRALQTALTITLALPSIVGAHPGHAHYPVALHEPAWLPYGLLAVLAVALVIPLMGAHGRRRRAR